MATAKLKTLKVAELKDILVNAGVSFPPRANKSDLIAKISASSDALNAFNAIHGPPRGSAQKSSSQSVPPQNDDLLAPPEDVDWNSDAVDAPPVTKLTPVKHVQKSLQNAPKPSGKLAPATTPSVTAPPVVATKAGHSPATAAPAPVITPPALTATSTTAKSTKPSVSSTTGPSTQPLTAEDEELEKRRKRAERFGVPFVEPPKPKQAPPPKATQPRTGNAKTVYDPEKLAARAARFGSNTSASAPAQKRASPVDTVDKEELERRAKRAKRFGLPQAVAKNP